MLFTCIRFYPLSVQHLPTRSVLYLFFLFISHTKRVISTHQNVPYMVFNKRFLKKNNNKYVMLWRWPTGNCAREFNAQVDVRITLFRTFTSVWCLLCSAFLLRIFATRRPTIIYVIMCVARSIMSSLRTAVWLPYRCGKLSIKKDHYVYLRTRLKRSA